MAIHNSNVNVYLVSTRIEGVSHTHLVGKSRLHMYERTASTTCTENYMPANSSTVMVVKSPLDKVFVCDLGSGLLAAMLESISDCVCSCQPS